MRRATVRPLTYGEYVLTLLGFALLFSRGVSQKCVNGLMSAESVRQLGRVAGNRRSDLDDQQRIVPDISFTCSGTVTRWIVAGQWSSQVNLPEVQIWRETATGSGIYTKIHGTILPLGSNNASEIYSFRVDSVDFQPGDIFGLFEPEDTWLRFYYTDTYGPVSYDVDTGGAVVSPTGDFDISDADGTSNTLPLVSVEITPTDNSSAAECIRNFASMNAIVIGIQQTGTDRPIVANQRQQRLIPGITFTCHGFITKWIIAARWDNDENYPELQTWRNLTDDITYTKQGALTDDITYTKQGATTFSVEGESEEMTYYEYSPSPPHEFNDGDVLGMFIPDDPHFSLFFHKTENGPLNYIDWTGGIDTPPRGDFITSEPDIFTAAALPLIAVEIILSSPLVAVSSRVPVQETSMSILPAVSVDLHMEPTSCGYVTSSPAVDIMDDDGSPPGNSDQLSAGILAGIAAAGAAAVVVLGVLVIVGVIVMRKKRVLKSDPTPRQLVENRAYGVRINISGVRMKRNPAYRVSTTLLCSTLEQPRDLEDDQVSGVQRNLAYGALEIATATESDDCYYCEASPPLSGVDELEYDYIADETHEMNLPSHVPRRMNTARTGLTSAYYNGDVHLDCNQTGSEEHTYY